MKFINLPIIFLIKIYKWCISPLLPQACRFEPSCSAYALDCFKNFSLFQAFYLATRRLLRCNPFCSGGYDPIPPVKIKN